LINDAHPVVLEETNTRTWAIDDKTEIECDDNFDFTNECNVMSTVDFDKEILDSVKASYEDDSLFRPVIESPDQYPLYTVTDGLIYFEGRLCIPKNDRNPRNSLLALYHDSQNHFAVSKTYRAITRDYFWPEIVQDVDAYIKSCDSCARNKSSTQSPTGLLHPMPIPQERFSEIAMDFVGPLPKCKGFDMLLVMTDRLTNYVKMEPTKTTATAPDIADLLYRSWYRQFGLPSAITCAGDKLFTSKFWKQLFKRINIQLRMSTSFHPEMDGSSERSNKTVIESLRHYVSTHQTDWAEHLIHVETVMNNSVNATTSKTPTELLYGTPIRLFPVPIENRDTILIPSVGEYLERIEMSIAIARDRHAEAKTQQTTQANKHRRAEPHYEVGDLTYLDTRNLRLHIKQKGRSAKFYPRFIGPFKILESKPETSSYKLELPQEYKIHLTFHTKRLKPAIPNDVSQFPHREPSRPPPEIDDPDLYEIEKIMDHRDTRGGRQFLVCWLGYPPSDDEWIHEGHIEAKELITEYLEEVQDLE